MSYILVADDELPLRQAIDRLLRMRGHTTDLVESGETAIDAVRAHRPDLLLLDVQMPGMGGMEALGRLQQIAPDLPVIIMTAAGSIEVAVEAFKRGAVDFVTKPFTDVEKLFTAVDNATRPADAPHPTPALVGESPAFREALRLARLFARPDINVLLLGETGTGKELFARTIHDASERAAGPFVPVDGAILAATLVESELFGHEKGSFTGATQSRIGHFERANGGTLFLDEIGNLSLETQAKLLRVLQERTMTRVGGRETIQLDIRVVAATNVNLQDAVARGTFRADLFYRLAEMVIPIPPLREREGDVRRISEHFLQLFARKFERRLTGFTPAALRKLEDYPWTGNVRALRNVILSAVILADGEVRPEHIVFPMADRPPVSEPPVTISSGVGAQPAFAPVPSAPRSDPELDAGVPAPGERMRIPVEFTLDFLPGEHALATVARMGEETAERALLEAVLRLRRYNHTQLAKLLNVDPKTLRAKLRKYGLEG